MQPNQRFALHAAQPRQAEGLPEGLPEVPLEVPEFDPGLLRRHRIRVRRLIRRIKAGYGDPQDEPCTGLDHAAQPHQPEETNMSYQDRDKHGMYKGEGAAPVSRCTGAIVSNDPDHVPAAATEPITMRCGLAPASHDCSGLSHGATGSGTKYRPGPSRTR